MAAQFLGDRLDLPGRDALHVHLGQRRHGRLLGALIAFEEFGREPPVSGLRHAQLELAHPGDEGAAVIAGAVTEPGCGALALFGPERVGHLGFQHLLHHRANDLAQAVRALRKEFVDGGDRGLSFTLGHDGVPHRESVTSTSPACHDRLSPSAILQNLQHTTLLHWGGADAVVWPRTCAWRRHGFVNLAARRPKRVRGVSRALDRVSTGPLWTDFVFITIAALLAATWRSCNYLEGRAGFRRVTSRIDSRQPRRPSQRALPDR